MSRDARTVTRFQCVVCGKLTRGRKPKGGDGSFYYPSKHGGCAGEWRAPKWVDVPVTKKSLP